MSKFHNIKEVYSTELCHQSIIIRMYWMFFSNKDKLVAFIMVRRVKLFNQFFLYFLTQSLNLRLIHFNLNLIRYQIPPGGGVKHSDAAAPITRTHLSKYQA